MRYPVIYADPPWSFAVWSAKARSVASRMNAVAFISPEAHYDSMSLGDLAAPRVLASRVPDMAAKDCCLFMWATMPMLPPQSVALRLKLMKAWGFFYKTVAFTWVKRTVHDKEHVGLGYWTRSNPELCLLGARGKPKRKAKDVRQLVTARSDASRVREHSRKPEEVRRQIEAQSDALKASLSGVDGPYLELFARETTQSGALRGWSSWGNETGLFDTFKAYRRMIRGVRKTPLRITVLEYADSIDQRIFEIVRAKSELAHAVDPTHEVHDLRRIA